MRSCSDKVPFPKGIDRSVSEGQWKITSFCRGARLDGMVNQCECLINIVTKNKPNDVEGHAPKSKAVGLNQKVCSRSTPLSRWGCTDIMTAGG